jgi:hypothetical protein
MKGTKVELLERAQELMQNALVLIEEATEGDANARAYLVDHLKIMITNNHGFLSNNLNIDKLIQRYEDLEEIEYSDEIEEIMEGNF